MIQDDLDFARALLAQIGATEYAAAIEQQQQRLAAVEAQLPDAFQQIDGGLLADDPEPAPRLIFTETIPTKAA